MIFKKPKDVRYVEMAMYVDEKIKQQTISEEESSLIYEYLYHLIYMLAVKNKYFNKEVYYDEFAITLATDVFHRLFTNPKLYKLDENGQPKMKRIKSCLNYIKAILYGRKVTFEQQAYSQKYVDVDYMNSESTCTGITSYSYIRDSMNFSLDIDMKIYLESLSKTVKHFLYTKSPYRNDKILMKNIYISCMLSLLKMMSFTVNDIEGIENKYTKPEAKFRYLSKMYKQNRDGCVTLYHLSYKYHDYINLLVRQLCTLIGKDIQEICSTNISIPEDVLMNISLMEVTGKRDCYDD